MRGRAILEEGAGHLRPSSYPPRYPPLMGAGHLRPCSYPPLMGAGHPALHLLPIDHRPDVSRRPVRVVLYPHPHPHAPRTQASRACPSTALCFTELRNAVARYVHLRCRLLVACLSSELHDAVCAMPSEHCAAHARHCYPGAAPSVQDTPWPQRVVLRIAEFNCCLIISLQLYPKQGAAAVVVAVRRALATCARWLSRQRTRDRCQPSSVYIVHICVPRRFTSKTSTLLRRHSSVLPPAHQTPGEDVTDAGCGYPCTKRSRPGKMTLSLDTTKMVLLQQSHPEQHHTRTSTFVNMRTHRKYVKHKSDAAMCVDLHCALLEIRLHYPTQLSICLSEQTHDTSHTAPHFPCKYTPCRASGEYNGKNCRIPTN